MVSRTLPLVFAFCLGCSTTAQSGQVDPPPTPTGTGEAPAPALVPVPPSASAAPTGNVTTLYVDAARVPCEGEGMTECLRTKDTPDGSWMLFYRTIEGFTFEPGTFYVLRVEVTKLGKTPADSSSLRYRLVEVVSKKKAP